MHHDSARCEAPAPGSANEPAVRSPTAAAAAAAAGGVVRSRQRQRHAGGGSAAAPVPPVAVKIDPAALKRRELAIEALDRLDYSFGTNSVVATPIPTAVAADATALATVAPRSRPSPRTTRTRESAAVPGAASPPATATDRRFLSPLLSAAVVCDALSVTMLLPFVGLLVVKYTSLPTEQAGLLSGLLVGIYQLCMAAVARTWGSFGDRFGRRPAMILALFGSAIAVLGFGLSGSFVGLVCFRALHGFLGTASISVKAAVPELATADEEATLWATLTFASTLGAAVGPVLGGVLYDPAAAWSLLEGTVLESRPALLPCLLVAVASGGAGWVALKRFPECNPKARPLPRWVPLGIAAALSAVPMSTAASAAAPADQRHDHVGAATVAVPNSRVGPQQQQQQQRAQQLSGSAVAEPSAAGLFPGDEVALPLSIEPSRSSTQSPATAITTATAAAAPTGSGASFGFLDVWRHGVLRRVIAVNCGLGAAGSIYVEVLPLLCIVDRAGGGLDIASSHIDILFTAQSVFVAIANLWFRAVLARCDRSRLLRVCIVLYTATLLAIPAVVQLAVRREWTEAQAIIALVSLSSVRAPSICFVMGVLLMAVPAASPPEAVGQITGVAHSVNAFFRAAAPIAATPIFAWSMANGLGFPFNVWLVFLLAAAIAAAALVVSLSLSTAQIVRK